MAAGDVTIKHGETLESGNVSIVIGDVQLDGSNPTPVYLGSYGKYVIGGLAFLAGSTLPGVGAGGRPPFFVTNPNGDKLDIYAAAPTSGADATPIASTNNTAIATFVALVRH